MENENVFAGTVELKDFIEKMPGGFFIYYADRDEKIIYANDITLEIFGCETFEEFMDLVHGSFKGLVYPSDYKKISHSINQQVAKDTRHLDYVEYRIIRKDGAIRYLDDYGRLVHTEEYGDVYYVFIRDVTEVFEERRENIRRAKVIEGLSADFSSIFLYNLDKDIIKPYRLRKDFPRELIEELNLASTGFLDCRKLSAVYAEKFIYTEDREFFLQESSGDRIIERVQTEPSYKIVFRSFDENKKLVFVEMSVVSIEKTDPSYVITAFRKIQDKH